MTEPAQMSDGCQNWTYLFFLFFETQDQLEEAFICVQFYSKSQVELPVSTGLAASASSSFLPMMDKKTANQITLITRYLPLGLAALTRVAAFRRGAGVFSLIVAVRDDEDTYQKYSMWTNCTKMMHITIHGKKVKNSHNKIICVLKSNVSYYTVFHDEKERTWHRLCFLPTPTHPLPTYTHNLFKICQSWFCCI